MSDSEGYQPSYTRIEIQYFQDELGDVLEEYISNNIINKQLTFDEIDKKYATFRRYFSARQVLTVALSEIPLEVKSVQYEIEELTASINILSSLHSDSVPHSDIIQLQLAKMMAEHKIQAWRLTDRVTLPSWVEELLTDLRLVKVYDVERK